MVSEASVCGPLALCFWAAVRRNIMAGVCVEGQSCSPCGAWAAELVFGFGHS
jgi:hypothetical protein